MSKPTAPVDLAERLRRLALAAPAGALCELATQVVPGFGAAQAPLVLVGEAPGEQEDRQGRPFVGRSGALLDELLTAAGLERERLYVTNAVKCRPVALVDGRKRNRPPKASEVRAWSEVLAAELELIRPRAVVGLGAVAGRALVAPDFRITRLRGQWLTERLTGCDLIVTWHPAYLLRQHGAEHTARLAEAVADLRAARERIEGP